jgi:hypothetical protein
LQNAGRFLCAIMMQNIGARIERIATALLVIVGIYYVGEFISIKYRIPASREPLGTVQVTQLYAVLQKDGKTEYEAGEPQTQTCVNSIFPHLGYSPCWYVERHKVQQVNL